MVSLESFWEAIRPTRLAVLDRAALDANYGAGTAKRVNQQLMPNSFDTPSMAFPRADRSLGARRLL